MEVILVLLAFIVGVPALVWVVLRGNRYWNRVPGARPPEAVEADYRNAGIRLVDGLLGVSKTATGELDGIPFSVTLSVAGPPYALLEMPAHGAGEFNLAGAESEKLGYQRIWVKGGKIRARRDLVVEYPELETLRTWLKALATLRR